MPTMATSAHERGTRMRYVERADVGWDSRRANGLSRNQYISGRVGKVTYRMPFPYINETIYNTKGYNEMQGYRLLYTNVLVLLVDDATAMMTSIRIYFYTHPKDITTQYHVYSSSSSSSSDSSIVSRIASTIRPWIEAGATTIP